MNGDPKLQIYRKNSCKKLFYCQYLGRVEEKNDLRFHNFIFISNKNKSDIN